MSATALEVTVLLAIGVGLTLYVLLGGADFGGGVWDLLANGPERDRERSLISSAIGPVWEANHVWLIFVVTILFAAFPIAFAALSVALYVPFGISIAGIVMRARRSRCTYGEPDTGCERGRGVRSPLVTPFARCAAAIAGGIGSRFGIVHADPWACGRSTVKPSAPCRSRCAYLAAVYLTVSRRRRPGRAAFRRWALMPPDGRRPGSHRLLVIRGRCRPVNGMPRRLAVRRPSAIAGATGGRDHQGSRPRRSRWRP